MYGQFPRISDIRGLAPGVPAMPVVAQTGFNPPAAAAPSQPGYVYRPQDVQWGGQEQQPTFHRAAQQLADAVFAPKDQPQYPGLPTPDDTPPDAFQLPLPGPGLGTLPPAQGRSDSSAFGLNVGLGLIFEPTGDAAGQPELPVGQQDARFRLHGPGPQPRAPPQTHQERVLEAVARWMAGPAQTLANGVDLVYTMAACDGHLPRNEMYDASAYDEEDVDSDEE